MHSQVLHPGVEAAVALDLYLMRTCAALVEVLLPLRGVRWLSLAESVDRFAAFMSAQVPSHPIPSHPIPFTAFMSAQVRRPRGGHVVSPPRCVRT